MKIEVDDEFCGYLIDAVDALIKSYDQYGYKIEDIPKIAALGIGFKSRAKKAVKEFEDPDDKYAREHPEFIRGPNPGEKFVYGKPGYQKVGKDEQANTKV